MSMYDIVAHDIICNAVWERCGKLGNAVSLIGEHKTRQSRSAFSSHSCTLMADNDLTFVPGPSV